MFEEHKVEWTPEKVGRFWDHITQKDSMQDTYFSKQVGDDLIRKVKKHISLKGEVLDYGCGNGDLVEKLAGKKIYCSGVDHSSESVETTKKRMAGKPQSTYFRTAYTIERIPSPNLESDAYDTVFLIETIEHMFEDELETIFGEIKRVLKKGGFLVVTTPNDENIEAASVCCPDCGSVFHHFQHMISWNKESITRFMEKTMGFKTEYCEPTLFFSNTKLSPFVNIAYKALRPKMPHLAYIGQKV